MKRLTTASPHLWSAILLLCVLGLQPAAWGHVQLAYPPPTLKLDFLDTFRTSGICGHSASGSDNSGYWKLPEPDEDTVTPMQAGSKVTVAWDLHYAHQGGFRLELYNSDLDMVSVWNDSSHWGCNHDGTQQQIDLTLPETSCEGCVLRLQRQALEWGDSYMFHSCSLVNIVDNEEIGECNGCSGHGTCVKGKCNCQSNAEDGFWYGKYCEHQNECEEDAHCGEHGLCIDTKALTAPTKQCYCKEGYFGEEKRRGSTISTIISTRECSRESELVLGDPEDWEEEYPHMLEAGETMSIYYRVDEDAGEIEFAVRAKTVNWLSFGLRAASIKDADGDKASTKEEEIESDGEEPASEPAADDAESPPASEGPSTDDTASEDAVQPESAEPEGRRRMLYRMPELDKEAEEVHRSLMADVEDDTAESENAEPVDSNANGLTKDAAEPYPEPEVEEPKGAEAESEAEAPIDDDAASEAEPGAKADSEANADSEKSPTGVGCIPGEPTIVESDEGIHFKKPIATGATLGDKYEDVTGKAESEGTEAESETESETTPSGSGRRLSEMPKIDDELQVFPSHQSGRNILEDEAASEAEGASEADAASEAEAATEAEPTGSTSEDEPSASTKNDSRVYFAVGTTCENLVVDDPSAHAMINQDMIVAYAKGETFRIQDTFTPSRARPLPDAFFGGTDDVLDAVGKETEDGYTLIKLRRKLATEDQAGDYCIMPHVVMLQEVNYFVIYAIGQGPEPSHKPPSSLETGRASNKNFYGEDELKYHGGGINTPFPGRGAFGFVDFFEDVQEKGSCVPSSLEGFDCMSFELGGAFELHWHLEDDGVRFGAKSTGTGWISVAFPESPGVMIGADAVLGWDGANDMEFDVYKLEGKTPDGIVEGNSAFEVEDVSIETAASSTLFMFTRMFDGAFTGAETDLPLLVAFHADDKEDFSHHGSNRAGTTIDLTAVPSDDLTAVPSDDLTAVPSDDRTAVPSDDLAVETPCTPSDLEGFDCVSEQLNGKIQMNWKKEEDGVKMSLVLDGTGYVSVAWPEAPGEMVGAEAVIAWMNNEGPHIGVYKMESKSASGVIESDAFEITNPEITVVDGKTTLTFTRPFDAAGRRKLLFTPDVGPTDLLFAYHESDTALVHHSARDGVAVDLNQQPAESVQTPDCEPSDIEGYSCMTEADSFSVHWESGEENVAFAVRALESGYVALGWPESPGVMIGAMAVIGWITDNGDPSVGVYALDGKSADEVVPDANGISGISDLTVEELDGTTTMFFTRAIGGDFEPDKQQDLIFAFNSEDELDFHSGGYGSISVNLLSGEAITETEEDLKGIRKAHGWLMFVGWGLLLPIGIIVARTLKDKNPAWFYFHVSFQVLGMVVALIGWILALVKFDPPDNFRHGMVGNAVTALGIIQGSAVFRPKHGARFREFWEYVHWSVGRVALVLAVYNIFTGLDRYGELDELNSHMHVKFGMWLLALFVVYLALEARSQRIKKSEEKRELEEILKAADVKVAGAPQGSYSGQTKEVELRRNPVGVTVV